jgi:hypothetical protein
MDTSRRSFIAAVLAPIVFGGCAAKILGGVFKP